MQNSLAKAAVLLILLSPLCCSAQAKAELAPAPPIEAVEGERQGQALVSRLLEQRPEQPATNSGVLKIRDSEGNTREVSTRFEVQPAATNWLNVYESTGAPSSAEKLTIIHSNNQPNQYLLETGPQHISPRQLGPNDAFIPFAGSDFWIVDLGLDFLHWPQQRVLRKQMRKGLSCDVLQSINPRPVPGGYSRVVSWIAINRPEDIVIVHAEAFDVHDKLLKEFDPKKVEKVNGVWQLEEMEIRNRQTGSRTRIDFNL
jgi:hypothetical protein